MLEWLVSVNAKCREIATKARDAKAHLAQGERDAAKTINGYMKVDAQALDNLWKEADPESRRRGRISDLSRHIHFGAAQDYDDILSSDLPQIVETAEQLALEGSKKPRILGFEALLHPAVVHSSLRHYKDGHLRDAVLNGVIAIFDMIRKRTGLDLDGTALTGQAFGLDNGRLIFSEVSSDSGKNDQKGFLKIYEGVYAGVRNVKAHSLNHDLNETKAAQYLVMLSLLARRVEECKERV